MQRNDTARFDEQRQQARFADSAMLATLGVSGLAAVAIGFEYAQAGLAIALAAVLLVAGAAGFAMGRGRFLGQVMLVLANAGMVALHIQLGRGTLEFHFGVFVLLGLVLVYRDWRAVVLTAAFFAVHHLLFDRLQALGWAVYCTPQADLFKTLFHALYVVAQTAVEVALALALRRATVTSGELAALVGRIDDGQSVCLDVSAVRVATPIGSALKAALVKIHAAVVEVGSAGASIENASREIASGNLDLSRRTEDQAASLQRTASSMGEITGTVQDLARSAEQADRLAREASSTATAGGDAVARVVETIDGIAQSSHRIQDIVATIDGLAFQTNILALNAAVEAARAGEQGRGFAVVASEVRSLAMRSAAAAKEIRGLIADSTERVDRGTQLVADAGASMQRIVDQARDVSALIGQISASAHQQTAGIGEVGQAVGRLDGVTQQNAALVEQSAAAAESLRHQAQALNAVVGRFSLGAG